MYFFQQELCSCEGCSYIEQLPWKNKYLLHVKQTFTGKGTKPLWSNSCCAFLTFFPVVSSFLLLLLVPEKKILKSFVLST